MDCLKYHASSGGIPLRDMVGRGVGRRGVGNGAEMGGMIGRRPTPPGAGKMGGPEEHTNSPSMHGPSGPVRETRPHAAVAAPTPPGALHDTALGARYGTHAVLCSQRMHCQRREEHTSSPWMHKPSVAARETRPCRRDHACSDQRAVTHAIPRAHFKLRRYAHVCVSRVCSRYPWGQCNQVEITRIVPTSRAEATGT